MPAQKQACRSYCGSRREVFSSGMNTLERRRKVTVLCTCWWSLRICPDGGTSVVMSSRRHLLYPGPCRTLLEFLLNTDSGTSCGTVSMDVPVSGLYRSPRFVGCQQLVGSPTTRTRFIAISYPLLVFDKQTHTFYQYPKFCLALVCDDRHSASRSLYRDSSITRPKQGLG